MHPFTYPLIRSHPSTQTTIFLTSIQPYTRTHTYLLTWSSVYPSSTLPCTHLFTCQLLHPSTSSLSMYPHIHSPTHTSILSPSTHTSISHPSIHPYIYLHNHWYGEQMKPWVGEVLSGCVLLMWTGHIKDQSLRLNGDWQGFLPRWGSKKWPNFPLVCWYSVQKISTIAFSPPDAYSWKTAPFQRLLLLRLTTPDSLFNYML